MAEEKLSVSPESNQDDQKRFFASLVEQVVRKLNEQNKERVVIVKKNFEDRPDFTLFLDRTGRWLSQDFDTAKYGKETFLVPNPEAIVRVFAHHTDKYLECVQRWRNERIRTVGRKMAERERSSTRIDVPWYDLHEEALDKIVDFYAAKTNEYLEVYEPTLRRELIEYLVFALTSGLRFAS